MPKMSDGFRADARAEFEHMMDAAVEERFALLRAGSRAAEARRGEVLDAQNKMREAVDRYVLSRIHEQGQ